jgi:HTH-type transcriptional regulator, competence development regulator
MESFGNLIRRSREVNGLLLREVASQLDIDPSLLSRIECNKKRAPRELVIRLATILGVDEKELIIAYLSDNIVYELEGEELALHAMSAAEEKIRYLLINVGASVAAKEK